MITKEKVKCGYPTALVNGMQLACDGNHPTYIHEEVVANLDQENERMPKDLVKRIFMAELPMLDEYNCRLCIQGANDPVNEQCLLRVDAEGNHVCGSQNHFTISHLRNAKAHELHSRDRELQLLYLKVASLADRTAFFKEN